MKPLYKQILSEKDSVSFIPEKFNSDNEVLHAIGDYYNNHIGDFDLLTELLQSLNTYNANGIFVKSGVAITDISNGAFNSWNVLRSAWNRKILHIACHRILGNRHLFRPDFFYSIPRILDIYILRHAIALHLDVCRNRNVLPSSAIIVCFFKSGNRLCSIE